ncbi:cellulose synthase complex periplasmic endoglucanase BcsZ [Pseudomonas baetica]|uniref:cellulose synthase complex periplasmic endoglucanase BcsZ n=1 Tax=Pseudomonas baetica TaxID=674054 RepID=UPI002406314E|nr:cellulose synthase complex periplasmic endoglucanase BcsZ [Pseudomonas baetica]MDF9776138.1 endoglucanase [Pseudomonas baetica]
MKNKSARSRLLAAFLPLLALPAQGASQCVWPAWENFKQHLISDDGRVIDASSPQQITTSEGQSYGLFFALVANDRKSFDRLLTWTRNNLADGDLGAHLPAWQWGRDKDGQWGVLDGNNASDADLWIAYSLLEAGRLWRRPDYLALGNHLLWRSAAQTLRKLPGLGLMLLPGDVGFESSQGWRLNLSYLPPQLLTRFALIAPVWTEVAQNSRRALIEGSPKGFAPDWLMWQAGQGFSSDAKGSDGSYDAIRVYLWVGMLAADAPERTVLLNHFKPMIEATARLRYVPEHVDSATGESMGAGPVGFSAALLPLLASDASAAAALSEQREHLRQSAPLADAYYNQSLVMFGQGWDEHRYRFDKDGRLQPNWTSPCTH